MCYVEHCKCGDGLKMEMSIISANSENLQHVREQNMYTYMRHIIAVTLALLIYFYCVRQVYQTVQPTAYTLMDHRHIYCFNCPTFILIKICCGLEDHLCY
jgi:hypothetical protein